MVAEVIRLSRKRRGRGGEKPPAKASGVNPLPIYRVGDMVYFGLHGTEFSAPVEGHYVDEGSGQAYIQVTVRMRVNVEIVERVERARPRKKGGAA